MAIIYHLVQKVYFDAQDPNSGYVPKAYARDGFIHCTKDAAEMARVANRFYNQEPPPHVYLYIDPAKVRAEIRYEDEGHLYPHIYGELNRDAIMAIRLAQRDKKGNFLPPERLTNDE